MADEDSIPSLERLTRAQAKERGIPVYYTGKPCIYGHDSPRRTAGGSCDECLRTRRAFQRGDERAVEWAQESQATRLARVQSESNRLAAIDSGESTYLGARCPRGHSGVRYVGCYGCVECPRADERVVAKRSYDKEYRAKNAKKLDAYRAQWGRANPTMRLAVSKAYKARRRAVEKVGDTTADLRAWEQAAKKICYWCGCKCQDKYHVDHYQPLARGGLHAISNLVIACPPCNQTKSAKDPYKFAQEKGKLF